MHIAYVHKYTYTYKYKYMFCLLTLKAKETKKRHLKLQHKWGQFIIYEMAQSAQTADDAKSADSP
jgi:hypothetical protein